MRFTRTIIFISCIAIPVLCLGQETAVKNDFKIGMFGFEFFWVNGQPPTTLKVNNYNSSQLNVLAEDGFNIATRYNPDYWTSTRGMTSLLNLARLNDMQIMTNAKDWYKANPNNPRTLPNGEPHSTLPGINVYNSKTSAHPDFDSFFDNLYHLPRVKNQIWGHQICEESAFFNLHNYTNNAPASAWPP